MSYSDLAHWLYIMSLTTQVETYTENAVRRSIRGVVNQRFRAVLNGLVDIVANGTPLSDAMEQHPRWFPPFVTRMIRLGEQCGRESYAFDVLSQYCETLMPAHRRLNFAWIFPLVFAAGATFLMVLLGGALFGWHEAMQPVWPLVIEAVILLLLDRFVIDRIRIVRVVLDTISTKVPLWGRSVSDLAIYTFASNMGLYYQAGQKTVAEKWAGSARSVANLALSDRLLRGLHVLEDGGGLASAMERTGVFDKGDVATVRRSEELGQFDSAFEALSRMARDRASRRLKLFCALTHRVVIGIFALLFLSVFLIAAMQSVTMSEVEEYAKEVVVRQSDTKAEADTRLQSLDYLLREENNLVLLAVGSLQIAPPLVFVLLILAVLIRPRHVRPEMFKSAPFATLSQTD